MATYRITRDGTANSDLIKIARYTEKNGERSNVIAI